LGYVLFGFPPPLSISNSKGYVVAKVKVSIGAGGIGIVAWHILGPKWAAHTDGYDLNVDDCTIHNKEWVETLGVMTNTSDFRCVKGIWYAVADAIKIGWNQMGTQAKGFFVALLFSSPRAAAKCFAFMPGRALVRT
jgi:hypothetical protein